jgi:serine/threonine protein kinase
VLLVSRVVRALSKFEYRGLLLLFHCYSLALFGNCRVGNLTFVTDVEMFGIMYGDTEHDSDSDGSINRFSCTSLPPSAILGKGAFSTVRLAWRKTHSHYNRRRSSMASSLDSDLDMELSHEKFVPETPRPIRNHRQSRRSIVRVISRPIDDSSQTSSKGDLVAVKMIQKSILKQMKTMTKDANNPNRVTVRTAFDNIEREIAMMKRLQHPNLVRLFEVIDSVESDKLFMVLEFLPLGEILSHVEGTNMYKRTRYKKKVRGLTPGGYFDEKNAALYFVDIMHGLAYLHR